MAKKEVKTDLWVARQLDDSKIKYDAQGSDIKEINDALQSASKRGTGNAGYPEYVAVVKDFVSLHFLRFCPATLPCWYRLCFGRSWEEMPLPART